jgi:hypothetical protein
MSREEAILEAIREIAPDKEKDILVRAEQISSQPPARKKSFPSLAGIWSDLKIDLSEEDMKEARREMWKNFPREFPEDDV